MRTLKNKKTGEVIQVEDNEVGKYGITAQAQPAQAAQTSLVSQPTEPVAQNVTGHSLLEHTQALEKAQAAGDTDAVKSIKDNYDREFQYQQTYGEASDTFKKTVERQRVKSELIQKAQNVVNIIKSGEKGELTGQDYKDKLDAATSDWASASGFGEGGKSLTAIELSMLSGKQPSVQEYKGNIGDWIKQQVTGFAPPKRFKTADTEDQLLNKAAYIIYGLSGDPEKATKMTSEDVKKEMGFDKITPVKTKKENAPNFQVDLLNNAVNIAKGVPGMAMKSSAPGMMFEQLTKGPKAVSEENKQMGLGMIENLGKHTGVSVDLNKEQPVEFNPLSGLAYSAKNPLDSLQWLLAGKGAIDTASGVLGGNKAPTGLPAETVNPLEGIVEPARQVQQGRIVKPTIGKEGRAFTSIAAPDPTSIVKSEQLMKDAFKLAPKANDPYGMAKELETFVPKAGKYVDEYVSKLNKPIGPQAGADIVDEIVARVKDTPAAQNLPDWEPKLRTSLENKLKTKEVLPGGKERGQLWATDLDKMNQARKVINQENKKWHVAGNPLSSEANYTQSLNDMAGNALKDMIAEADSQGVLKQAIDMEHTALKVAPVLAEKALGKAGAWSIRNAMYRQFIKMLETPKIWAARGLAGETNPLLNQILEGKLPETAGAQNAEIVPQPNAAPGPRYLPSNPPDYGNLPEPLKTLFRDMRTKQGNWQQKK